MKRTDLAKTVAKETNQSTAEAQDEIDLLVNKILKALRERKPVNIPAMVRSIRRRKSK